MEDYIPPYPKPLERRAGFFRRIREGQRCPLRLLMQRAYRMKMGEAGLLGRKRYLLVEAPLVRKVLQDAERIYPKSAIIWRMLAPVIGNSIFVSNGEIWSRQRRLLEPAFTETRVSRSFERMRSAVDDMIARMKTLEDGAIVDVEPIMTHVTADVIFRTICSVSISEAEAQQTYDAFMEYQSLAYRDMTFGFVGVPNLLSPRWWKSKKAAQRIREVMDPMVRERYERHMRGEVDTNQDILSALLTARDPDTGEPLNFDYDELVEQIAMLFLAGHETSAAALSWSLYLLAATPHFQDRVFEEAMQRFGDRAIESEDVRRLTFCRDSFREALRLYPSVPFIARDATRTERMRDKTVKAGSVLLLCPWLSHRSELYWDAPHVFDPDRFSRTETKKSLQDAYFPFSAGPRVCLGASFAMQEAVLVLANIFKHFRLETVTGETPMPIARLTLRAEHGIKVRLFRR